MPNVHTVQYCSTSVQPRLSDPVSVPLLLLMSDTVTND